MGTEEFFVVLLDYDVWTQPKKQKQTHTKQQTKPFDNQFDFITIDCVFSVKGLLLLLTELNTLNQSFRHWSHLFETFDKPYTFIYHLWWWHSNSPFVACLWFSLHFLFPWLSHNPWLGQWFFHTSSPVRSCEDKLYLISCLVTFPCPHCPVTNIQHASGTILELPKFQKKVKIFNIELIFMVTLHQYGPDFARFSELMH